MQKAIQNREPQDRVLKPLENEEVMYVYKKSVKLINILDKKYGKL